jgi:AAA family ATPase
MTAALHFTLRPLERRMPVSALEGGFRVQLSIRDLKALGLETGDLCRLSSPGGAGLAIAWLSQDANSSNQTKRIAKVTDLLRETYGFTLQDRISIEKANEPWERADTVFITPSDPEQSLASYESPDELEQWASYALGEVRAQTHCEYNTS